MVAKLVDFSDIAKLARLSKENKNLEFQDTVISMRSKYSFESFNPVLKAAFYANIGNTDKKILNKWLHLMSTFKEYQFYSPYSSECHTKNAAGLAEAKKQENITTHITFSKFCDIKANNLNLIPHITHNIWVLSSTLQNIDTQVKTFNKHHEYQKHNYNITSHWEHYVWLTDPQAVTVALQNRILEDNYTIRYISELADNDQRTFLVSAALTFAEFGYYSFTTDILRHAILHKYGGVYLDGDYKIYHDLDKLVDNFESVTGYQAPVSVCNAFIAMSPQHLITQKACDLLVRNINLTNAPEYLKYPCFQDGKLLATDIMLSLSQLLLNEKLNNQTNLFLLSGILADYDYNTFKAYPDFTVDTYKSYGENCNESFMATEIGIIGKHDLLGSWKGDQLYKLDYNV